MSRPTDPDPTDHDLAQIREIESCHRQSIPEEYRDEMGHMNVRWYTHLFSQGARVLFESCGLDAAYMERENAGTFALKQYVEYKAEVLIGQEIAVHTRLIDVSDKRLHFMHYLINETRGVLGATMECQATHIDLAIRRSSPFPTDIRDRLDRKLSNHQGLNWPARTCGVIGNSSR